MFTTIFPIITTADLGAALRFYRDLLGARVSYEFPGPDGEPGYGVVDPDGNLVLIGQAAGG